MTRSRGRLFRSTLPTLPTLPTLAAAAALAATLAVSPDAWAIRIDVGTNGQCTIPEAVSTAMNPAQNPAFGCTRTPDGQARILIKIAAGTFSIPSNQTLFSSVIIEGAGITQTTINSPGRAFTVLGGTANPTVQIRDLKLKGQFSGEGVFVTVVPAAAVIARARIESFNIGVRVESPQNQIDGRATALVDNAIIADSKQGGITSFNSDVNVIFSTVAGNLGGGIRARLFAPAARVDVSVSRIDNNGNTGAGGGIRVTCEGSNQANAALSVSDTLIQFNQSSSHGGGVYTTCDTNLFRTDVKNNTSAAGGGGLAMEFIAGPAIEVVATASAFENNTADFGGGLMLDGNGTASALATVEESLFAGNRSAHDGGAIHSTGQPSFTNSTITLNTAGNPGQTARGGGIYHLGGELHMLHNTIANNAANTAGGGVMTNGNNFIMGFNIVADNSAPSSVIQSPDWVFSTKPGQPIGSRNLIRNRAGVTIEFPTTSPHFNLDNVSPGLGSLQNLGGFARVRPLLPGSAAMDRIPSNEDSEPFDQRRVARPQNGPDGAGRGNLRDIGAFEATP